MASKGILHDIYYNINNKIKVINPFASPSARVPALKYGDVNTETTSPGEVKELMSFNEHLSINYIIFIYYNFFSI